MKIKAGASAIKITPTTTQFLCGYPHVERYSTGVDTDLFSSSLYLDDGQNQMLIISNDILYFSKTTVSQIREKISSTTKLSPNNIMITCTHTHSGPVTIGHLWGNEGTVVPAPDSSYIEWGVNQVVKNALEAVKKAEDAEFGLVIADSSQVGGNRRDPQGPSNPRVPVMLFREINTGNPIALMMVVCIHPTVLHEDSKLVSADFPGYTRKYIQEKLGQIPVVYHTGPAGNQSSRHITRENTVAEACRLGNILGKNVLDSIERITFSQQGNLACINKCVEIPINDFPPVEEAEKIEREVFAKLEKMRNENADPRQTRTVECDWFGAERRLILSKLKVTGELEKRVRERCLPAEVQVIQIGKWKFASWPGEIFVEYALELMAKSPDTFPIAYTNGDTSGYLVTEDAVEEGGYEASTAILKSPESPEILVETALKLIDELK